MSHFLPELQLIVFMSLSLIFLTRQLEHSKSEKCASPARTTGQLESCISVGQNGCHDLFIDFVMLMEKGLLGGARGLDQSDLRE